MQETECVEAKKQVEVVEGTLRGVREEFEQSVGMLTRRGAELKDTREKLSIKDVELAEREEELKVIKGVLVEEVVVRKAHQETEAVLDGVAHGLKKAIADSLADICGLFGKLGMFYLSK